MRYLILFMLFCSTCYAEQQFNPMSGKWETCQKGSTPQFNSFTGEWSEQPQGAKTEYNPFNGQHEWDSGHNPSSDDD